MMRLYQFLAGSRETFERTAIPTIKNTNKTSPLNAISEKKVGSTRPFVPFFPGTSAPPQPHPQQTRAHYGQHSRLV
jgi:hypothetical protein